MLSGNINFNEILLLKYMLIGAIAMYEIRMIATVINSCKALLTFMPKGEKM